MDLTGRRAVVTGAGGGIGAATAEALARLGAGLVLVDRETTERLEAVRERIIQSGGSAILAPLDVADAGAVASLYSRGGAAEGADVLVNAAGVLFGTPADEVSEAEWDLVMDVNLKASFLMAQAALPAMRAAGWGRIVNVSSTAGKNVSTIGGVHYTAAKAGVLGLTRHLAKECAADGVTVNAVCPGLIDTAMVRTTIETDAVRRYAASFPIPRLGTPEEVADLIGFLSSTHSSYITGASVDINGGDLMI